MTALARERRRSRREQEELLEEAEAASAQPVPPHVEDALRLQQAAGNAAVSRLLQRQPSGASPGGGSPQLHLDPEIEAEIRRIQLEQLLRQLLDPSAVRDAVREVDIPVAGPPPWLPRPGEPAPAEPAPTVPRGAGPEAPQAASGSDLTSAVAAVPAVEQALDRLKTQATERASRDWSRLSGGEKGLLITSSVLIAGGALGGALSHEESRDFLLRQVSGRALPVPGIEGLDVAFTLERENVGVMFTLDVGKALPPSWGF